MTQTYETHDKEQALLGLASTEQLLRELICRFTVHHPHSQETQYAATQRALTLAEMLGGLDAPTREYRTVDHG
jgi:hypothetical protein